MLENLFLTYGMKNVITIIISLIIGIYIIYVLYLLSLDKLVKTVRTENEITFIHRAWVWTQLIPFWINIAYIVYNTKMTSAIRALEKDLKLEKNTIKYPYIILYIAATLNVIMYSNMDQISKISIAFLVIVLATISFILMIIYWIKIALTSRQILKLKKEYENNEEKEIENN